LLTPETMSVEAAHAAVKLRRVSGQPDETDVESRGEDAQLASLVRLLRDVLGGELVGGYLHGSSVLGGPTPTSDLDLLVVVRRGTTTEQRRRLVQELLVLSVPPSDERHARRSLRPIELTVVVASAIRPWRFPPEMDLQYGDWLREEFEAGRIPPPAANADLAILIALARQGDAPIVGPPPAEVFDPVPRSDIAAAMKSGIGGLLADLETDTRNVLLTLSRMWMTLATGEFRRKDAAARWAAARMPSELATVVTRAGELYVQGDYGPWGELAPRIRPAAHNLVSAILRL
jgi:streptomycin 3"-adenylyltransferase